MSRITRVVTPLRLAFLLLLGAAYTARGQTDDRRGDVSPDFGTTAAGSQCSCSSSVVAAVIITSLVFIVLGGAWWCFQERKRRRILAAKPDVEALGRAAYDNPQFQPDSDLEQVTSDGGKKHFSTQTTAVGIPPQKVSTPSIEVKRTCGTLEREKSTLERVMAAVIRGSRSDASKRAKDDSFLETEEVIVPLQGHDFTGLGFTIQGNLKEGLYVKDVLSRGPANESGKVSSGDKIISITVLTHNMVFKDALTILSYASPYPVLLHLRKNSPKGSFSSSSLTSKTKLNRNNSSDVKLIHPSFRSPSQTDLTKIGAIDISRVKRGNLIPPSQGKSSGTSTEAGRQVQRERESRHSERAIDVPGVDIKAKSITSDLDQGDSSKLELANVEVHHPMSKKTEAGLYMSSEPSQNIQDSNLKEVTEASKTDSKTDLIHPKTKIGVKVFPDLPSKVSAKEYINSGIPSLAASTKKEKPSGSNSKLTRDASSEIQCADDNQKVDKNSGTCLREKVGNFSVEAKGLLDGEDTSEKENAQNFYLEMTKTTLISSASNVSGGDNDDERGETCYEDLSIPEEAKNELDGTQKEFKGEIKMPFFHLKEKLYNAEDSKARDEEIFASNTMSLNLNEKDNSPFGNIIQEVPKNVESKYESTTEQTYVEFPSIQINTKKETRDQLELEEKSYTTDPQNKSDFNQCFKNLKPGNEDFPHVTQSLTLKDNQKQESIFLSTHLEGSEYTGHRTKEDETVTHHDDKIKRTDIVMTLPDVDNNLKIESDNRDKCSPSDVTEKCDENEPELLTRNDYHKVELSSEGNETEKHHNINYNISSNIANLNYFDNLEKEPEDLSINVKGEAKGPKTKAEFNKEKEGIKSNAALQTELSSISISPMEVNLSASESKKENRKYRIMSGECISSLALHSEVSTDRSSKEEIDSPKAERQNIKLDLKNEEHDLRCGNVAPSLESNSASLDKNILSKDLSMKDTEHLELKEEHNFKIPHIPLATITSKTRDSEETAEGNSPYSLNEFKQGMFNIDIPSLDTTKRLDKYKGSGLAMVDTDNYQGPSSSDEYNKNVGESRKPVTQNLTEISISRNDALFPRNADKEAFEKTTRDARKDEFIINKEDQSASGSNSDNEKGMRKEQSGINFKIKSSEYTFLNLGNKNEEISQSSKIEEQKEQECSDDEAKRSELNIAKAHIRVKSELNKQYTFLHGKHEDEKEISDHEEAAHSANLELNTSTASKNVVDSSDDETGENTNDSRSSPSRYVSIFSGRKPCESSVETNDDKNLHFKIPNTDLSGESNRSTDENLNFKIPNVEAYNSIFMSSTSTDQDGERETIEFKVPDLKTKVDSSIYDGSNSDYSLPDEIKVEVSNRSVPTSREISSSYQIDDYSLKSSTFNTSSQDTEIRTSSSENPPVDQEEIGQSDLEAANIRDLEFEFPEDEIENGLNVTDATKKKRFGFKIGESRVSEVLGPIFLKNPNESKSSHEVDSDNNQSDEMKSFNLKLKTNTFEDTPQDSLPTNEPSEPEGHAVERNDGDENSNLDNNSGASSKKIEIKNLSSHLPKISFEERIKQNESDEWKMTGSDTKVSSSNVSLLREKFYSKMKESSNSSPGKKVIKTPLPKTSLFKNQPRSTMESEFRINKMNFNADEHDFVIPDLKSQPKFSSSLSHENLSASHLRPRKVSTEPNESENNGKDFKLYSTYSNRNLSESDIHISPKPEFKSITPNFPISSADVNVSLDSSSIEAESDLPEVDSDFKRVSRDSSLDVPIPKLSMTKLTLEKNFNKGMETSPVKIEGQRENKEKDPPVTFKSAFGFLGFKKHMGSESPDKNESKDTTELKDTSVEEASYVLNRQTLQETIPRLDPNSDESPLKAEKHIAATKDLPEVDYDMDYKCKSHLDSYVTVNLPEGEQEWNNSEQKYSSLKENYREIEGAQGVVETEIKIEDSTSVLQGKVENPESNIKESDDYIKEESVSTKEQETAKTKLKIGFGFGHNKLSKSSDSEETEAENKVSKEPERENNESKEKVVSRVKKPFSIKGFGKSSSDTEEEAPGKVSGLPMQQGVTDDKNKPSNKGSINFGFKSKSTKSSDSEDNADSGKVELSPNVERSSKISKIKGNLGFGFINKSKSTDSEPQALETSNLKKDTPSEDDIKFKSENIVVIGHKKNKDGKYENRSESEGGEDEKLAMDSKGEETRSKSRYGIGFGFKKSQGKFSSDSEGGEGDDQKVHFDEKGSYEKTKEPKAKSLKLGFKGLRNLKGKIQTELNKMRHDSPSSDEENIGHGVEGQIKNEKRKKISKKKDTKLKGETEKCLNSPEGDSQLASNVSIVKEPVRKKIENESSSSKSSDEDEEDTIEQKKKKKLKLKKKEDTKVTTNVMNVGMLQTEIETNADNIVDSMRNKFDVVDHSQNISASHVTIVQTESKELESQIPIHNIRNLQLDTQSDPHNYVLITDMKLKENSRPELGESHIISEKEKYFDTRITGHLKDSSLMGADVEMGHEYWGSDGDMGQRKNLEEVKLSKVSGEKKVLTDSDELKRKATSLGDLSRLHEGAILDTLLERAVSLDLKNVSVGHSNLHVRRLQLPDSSATSIDEADEPLIATSPKKLEITGGLKSASQWGTLEEAMSLGIESNSHMKMNSSISAPSGAVRKSVLTKSSNEGTPISHIEISGERGSSITEVSVNHPNTDDSFEDEELPSLPSSPVPIEATTISVIEEDTVKNVTNEYSATDSSIVVVGNEASNGHNNFHNLKFQLNPQGNSQETLLLSSYGVISGSNGSINSDSGRFSPKLLIPGEKEDAGGVTITMVAAESHPNSHAIASGTNALNFTSVNPPLINHPTSSSSELLTYASHRPPLVTVNHDWIQDSGETGLEISDHNASDDSISLDSNQQKSMTQITLEGDGMSGYTVTEGTISRTVIISNPDETSAVTRVQTDNEQRPSE